MTTNSTTATATNTNTTNTKHYPALVKACDGTPVRVPKRVYEIFSSRVSRGVDGPTTKWCAVAYQDVLRLEYYIPTQYANVWIRIKRFKLRKSIEEWRFGTNLLFSDEQSLTSGKSLIGYPIKELVEKYEKERAELGLC